MAVEWRPSGQTAFVGQTIEIGLYAVSINSFEQPIYALEAILLWDPTKLRLVGLRDPCDHAFEPCAVCPPADPPNVPATYDWAGSCFPYDEGLDGLNAGCEQERCCLSPIVSSPANDGNAFYQAWVQPYCDGQSAPRAFVPASGLLVTNVLFETLELGATEVAVVASCTDVPGQPGDCYSRTRVIGGNVLGDVVTGPIGSPAAVTVTECRPPFVSADGSRYLLVQPEANLELVALRAWGLNPNVACLSGFIQANGTIGPAPVYLPPGPGGWATISVRHDALVARGTFRVQADCDPEDPGGRLSAPADATLWEIGDTNNDGEANIVDLSRILDAFAGNFYSRTCLTDADCRNIAPHFHCDMNAGRCLKLTTANVDLVGESSCRTDQNVTVFDLTAELDAFQGFPDPCSSPCP